MAYFGITTQGLQIPSISAFTTVNNFESVRFKKIYNNLFSKDALDWSKEKTSIMFLWLSG